MLTYVSREGNHKKDKDDLSQSLLGCLTERERKRTTHNIPPEQPNEGTKRGDDNHFDTTSQINPDTNTNTNTNQKETKYSHHDPCAPDRWNEPQVVLETATATTILFQPDNRNDSAGNVCQVVGPFMVEMAVCG